MNRKIGPIVVIVLALFLIEVLYFSFGIKTQVKLDSGYRLVMGTFARIVAVAEDQSTAKKCIEAAFEQIRNVDELMSDYKSDSQISKINRNAYKEPVSVSKPTFDILQRSIEFSKLSAGAFDITIGPLVDLWRLAAEANSVPTDAQIQQARSRVGCEKLILDANEMTVRFALDGMRIDLGGIAKGYAIDKAVETMQSCGAIGGMVDIGGDIRCFGAPPKGKKTWLIGLQDPTITKDNTTAAKSLLILNLKNAAVATSGSYRRFALIEGKQYSHIIDRKTGAGAEGLSSVTIIANNATDADALATAVSVMGPEKGLTLIEKIPHTEAILIPLDSLELIKTTAAEKYIK